MFVFSVWDDKEFSKSLFPKKKKKKSLPADASPYSASRLWRLEVSALSSGTNIFKKNNSNLPLNPWGDEMGPLFLLMDPTRTEKYKDIKKSPEHQREFMFCVCATSMRAVGLLSQFFFLALQFKLNRANKNEQNPSLLLT